MEQVAYIMEHDLHGQAEQGAERARRAAAMSDDLSAEQERATGQRRARPSGVAKGLFAV